MSRLREMGARRAGSAAVYLGFARHLPWSPRPGGRVAKRLRAVLGKGMLDRCGKAVNIEHGAWFGSGRGIELGDCSSIGLDALLIGPIRIGRDVMMGPRCMLIASSHRITALDVPMNQQGYEPDRPIVVEDDVWIGAGAIILPGVRIGHGSVIGAGSVVTRNVPSMSVAAGNPARVISRRERVLTDERTG